MAGWIVEATGTHGETMAVKVMALYPEQPTRDQQAEVRARVHGIFRVLYQEWPTTNSVRVYERP